jgi:kynureninase
MPTREITRADAERLDAADTLAGHREAFVFADDNLYLDGNSLGRMHRGVPEFVARIVQEGWGRDLIRGWDQWITWSAEIGDRLARTVLGARPREVVLSDSTSVNLYKLAAAALEQADPSRCSIVVDAEDFPTNRYIVQGLARGHGLDVRVVQSDLDQGMSLEQLQRVLDDDVALVVLSMVSYRSGAILDLAEINALACSRGVRVLWDLCHAAGVVPIDLERSGAELAVGCTYKFLNGGPGAPAFLYVRRDLQSMLRQPIQGWFGQRDQFGMGPQYDPLDNVDRFLVSTPPVLSMAPLIPTLDSIENAGIDRLREKSLHLGEFLVDLARERLEPLGFRLASPADATRRGGHVAFHHPDAWRICQALAAAAVICDYREPSRIRLATVPLYTRFVDVWDAVDRLHDVVTGSAHEGFPIERRRIT